MTIKGPQLAPNAAPRAQHQTPASRALSSDQRAAIKRLDSAAQQLEGVFLQMVMHAMRDTVPKDSIFGKQSMAEQMFGGMLDDQRAQEMSKTGSFGLAREMEAQLRDAVLSNASQEAHVDVDEASTL